MSIIREVNLDTNEVIDREMNKKELAQSETDHSAQIARETEAEAKATARAEILNRLGITANEAAILLG
jgi:hypothetical protein